MQLSGATKVLIIVSLILLVVMGGVVFMFLTIRSISTEAATIAQKVEVQKQRRNRFRSIQQMVTNNRSEIERVRSYLVRPDTDGTAAFLSRLEQLSEVTGATVAARSVEQVSTDDDGVERIALRLKVSGDWQAVYRTLALVETLPRDVEIDAAQFSAGSEGGWSGTIAMSVAKRTTTVPGNKNTETAATSSTAAGDNGATSRATTTDRTSRSATTSAATST